MENLAYKYKTPEEYLSFERGAVQKHEYYKGEVFAMSGNTIPHNRIQVNLLRRVGNHLDGKRCEVFGGELRVHVPVNEWYTYPDAIIVCDEPQLLDEEFDTILNPTVIVEILSKSTQSYDRGDKFSLYRSIPSLQQYILISSLKMGVEHHQRQPDNSWLLKETSNEQDSLYISPIQLYLPLSQIYAGVTFNDDRRSIN